MVKELRRCAHRFCMPARLKSEYPIIVTMMVERNKHHNLFSWNNCRLNTFSTENTGSEKLTVVFDRPEALELVIHTLEGDGRMAIRRCNKTRKNEMYIKWELAKSLPQGYTVVKLVFKCGGVK